MNSDRTMEPTPLKSNLIGFLILISLVLLTSHPLQAILNIEIKSLFVFVILFFSICTAFAAEAELIIEDLVYVVFVVFVSIVGSLVSGIIHQFLIGMAAVAIYVTSKRSAHIVMKQNVMGYLLILTYVVIAMAWIGFFYVLFGGGPTLYIKNPETDRDLVLYLSTFTNTFVEGLIRPAGIFDEPGALVMFGTLVTCLNELVGNQKRHSLIILLLIQITFSITAVIVFATYLAFFYKKQLKLLIPLSLLAAFIWIISPLINIPEALEEMFSGRFAIVDGRLLGDNRTTQVEEFIELADTDLLLKGAVANVTKYGANDQSSNPLTILYESGVFIWSAYLLVLARLVVLAWHSNRAISFCAVVIGILLLQRPYVFSMYWGLLIWITFHVILKRK